MDDAELYAAGGMSSSSPAMFERRRRILKEARRLIGQGHADGFSMRALCDRSGVAVNTLYNAFGSKENIIALAITQYFEDFHRSVTFDFAADTLPGVIEREIATTVRNLAIPEYVRAVTTLFFSATARPPVRSALINIAIRPYQPWFDHLRAARKLERGVAPERIAANLSALLYAQVQEWRIGEFDEAAFVGARLDAVLSYISGITRGTARQEVRAWWGDLHGDRALVGPVLAGALAKLELTGAATISL